MYYKIQEIKMLDQQEQPTNLIINQLSEQNYPTKQNHDPISY